MPIQRQQEFPIWDMQTAQLKKTERLGKTSLKIHHFSELLKEMRELAMGIAGGKLLQVKDCSQKCCLKSSWTIVAGAE